MKSKWYICTLFLIFALFGVFQEQIPIPNQEIVLEFVESSANEKNIKNTITNIKEKLLKVGISTIDIKKAKNGTLKISYYSAKDVKNIKEILLNENKLALSHNSENKEENKDSSIYKIDVYELTHQTDISKHDDKFIFEIKYSSDRFTSNYNNAFVKNIKLANTNLLLTTAFKIYKNSPFIKSKTSYEVPEARAGPFFCIG